MSKKTDPRNKTFSIPQKAYKAYLEGHSFVPHTAELLASPAWRSLGIHARRFIDLLELEHARHNGRENGHLKLTWRQMRQGGISSDFIASTIAEVEAVGLVTVTHRGAYRGGARNNPSTYRLDYLPWKLVPASGAPRYYAPLENWMKYRGGSARKKLVRLAPTVDQSDTTHWTNAASGQVGRNARTSAVHEVSEWPTGWERSSILRSTGSKSKQGAAHARLDQQREGDRDHAEAITPLETRTDRKRSGTVAIAPVDRQGDLFSQPSVSVRRQRRESQ